MIPFLKRRTPEEKLKAKKAIAEAGASIKKIEARNEEVAKVSHKMRLIREENHFAERLERLLKGGAT